MEAAAESRCPNCFAAPLNTPCRRCGWASGLDNPPPALALGTVLDGRYRIGRVLGHGGFGITYLAWDENLHLRLAIKEYLPRDSATRAPDGVSLAVYSGPAAEQFAYGLERFLEEARALARFDQHPGIVTVKSFFRAHGTGYCVMDYVEGLTFKQYLAQQPEGRLPFEQALKLLMPVMDALRAVHQDGLLHRDITPDNIYLTRSGRVKLLDFGAARFAAGEHSRSLSVILKPGYAPEEQYRTRGQQGPWTDVYGLAATLYRAITGQVPPEALDRLDADELVPPSQLGAVITPEQEAVLVRALAVRASARFESVEALQQAWREESLPPQSAVQPPQNAVSEADVSMASPPIQPVPRQRRMRTILVLLLAGALLVGGSLVYLQQIRQTDLARDQQQQDVMAHEAEVRRLTELAEQRRAEEARLAEIQQQRAEAEAAVRDAERARLKALESQDNTAPAAESNTALDASHMPVAPKLKIPLYFAADQAPTESIPPEAPLCYKFMVAGPEAQLQKLKAKYADLYDDTIVNNNDGSQTLSAKRRDATGSVVSYFYSTSPTICNDYQKRRQDLTVTTFSPVTTSPSSTMTERENRYIDQGDGTVIDTTTGLMWKRCSEGQTWDGKTCLGQASTMTWDQAMPNGRQKRWPAFAEHADWRMPTKDELLTLVYCSSSRPKTWNNTGDKCEGDFEHPTIDQTAFPNTPSSDVWSGSPFAYSSNGAWFVFFGGGYAGIYLRDDYGHVRLVRGGQ